MNGDDAGPLVLLGLGPDGWGQALLSGTILTLGIALTSMVIGSALGAVLAWMRAAGPGPLPRIAAGYGLVLRGVPELLVILLLYFSAPGLVAGIAAVLGLPQPGSPPPFLTGSLAIGLVSAAYQAEIFRGGLKAIAPGQIEAALAAGMTRRQILIRVILPQLVRHILPPLGNIWQFNLKDSALVAVTGLSDLMRASLVAAGSTRQPFLFFGAAMVLYLVLTTLSGLVFRFAEARANRWAR